MGSSVGAGVTGAGVICGAAVVGARETGAGVTGELVGSKYVNLVGSVVGSNVVGSTVGSNVVGTEENGAYVTGARVMIGEAVNTGGRVVRLVGFSVGVPVTGG